MKTSYKGNLARFERYKNLFEKQGRDFKIQKSGSMCKLIFDDYTWLFLDKTKDMAVPLLCRSVIKDAKKWIEEKNYNPVQQYRILNYMNIDNCLKNIKQVVYGYDINACYWNIAYREGIISEKTYQTGLESKDARLTAIGNLNKKTIEYNGDEKKVIDSPYSNVWHFIINEVIEMYKEVSTMFPKDFLAWRTDCVYIADEKHEKKIIEYFKSKGLEVKKEKIRLIEAHKTYISHWNYSEQKVKFWRDYKLHNYEV